MPANHCSNISDLPRATPLDEWHSAVPFVAELSSRGDQCPEAEAIATQSMADQRAKALADFQEAINDQDTLLADPARHVERLTRQARQSEALGIIDAEELRELLEWIDSVFA